MIATAPVTITDSAARQLLKVIQSEVEQNQALRIGVKGGGCSGLTYILDIDTPTDEDEIFEVNGVSFVLSPKHRFYLEGMTIDFSDGLDSRGFEFINPNAEETCGCGTSFSAS